MTTENRGGKREGSGRKNEGKVQVAFKLAPDVVECLRKERSKENPIAKIIEDLVRAKYNLPKP